MSTPREDLEAALAGRLRLTQKESAHWLVRSRAASDARGPEVVEVEARQLHGYALRIEAETKQR